MRGRGIRNQQVVRSIRIAGSNLLNNLQAFCGDAISSIVGSLALVLAGCTTFPITPTAPLPPPAVTPAAVFALELIGAPGPDFASGIAHLGIRARDAQGSLVAADVDCTSSAGLLMPARFNTRSTLALELARSQRLTQVSCQSGDATATIEVDMSAWGVDLQSHGHDPLRGVSTIHVGPRPRIAHVPLTRVTLDWGDGTVDVLPFLPLGTPGTLLHRYRLAGLYVATGRVDWPGGSYERMLTIAGGPGR